MRQFGRLEAVVIDRLWGLGTASSRSGYTAALMSDALTQSRPDAGTGVTQEPV